MFHISHLFLEWFRNFDVQYCQGCSSLYISIPYLKMASHPTVQHHKQTLLHICLSCFPLKWCVETSLTLHSIPVHIKCNPLSVSLYIYLLFFANLAARGTGTGTGQSNGQPSREPWTVPKDWDHTTCHLENFVPTSTTTCRCCLAGNAKCKGRAQQRQRERQHDRHKMPPEAGFKNKPGGGSQPPESFRPAK